MVIPLRKGNCRKERSALVTAPPTNGVEKGFQAVIAVPAGDRWQACLFQDLCSGLHLPDDLYLFAHGILVQRRQTDEVLPTVVRW